MAPALRLLGRRWHFSSDDCPVPSLFYGGFHLVWAALLAIALGSLKETTDDAYQYIVFYALLLALDVLLLITQSWLLWASLKGQCMQAQ